MCMRGLSATPCRSAQGSVGGRRARYLDARASGCGIGHLAFCARERAAAGAGGVDVEALDLEGRAVDREPERGEEITAIHAARETGFFHNNC